MNSFLSHKLLVTKPHGKKRTLKLALERSLVAKKRIGSAETERTEPTATSSQPLGLLENKSTQNASSHNTCRLDDTRERKLSP